MNLEHLISISVELDPPALLGTFPVGERRLITFTSGTFVGRDGLMGTLAPGGVDWQVVRADGVIEIRAHYLLRTDDGDPIEIVSDGLRIASPEVAERMASGEIVDPAEYYFRTHVRINTSSTRWDRLNRIIAVASGERGAHGVVIHVSELT